MQSAGSVRAPHGDNESDSHPIGSRSTHCFQLNENRPPRRHPRDSKGFSVRHDLADNHVVCTSGDRTNRSLYSPQAEAELETLDRRLGREYLPMDVYVDPEAVNERFDISSIRARWTRSHRGTT